MDRDRYKADSGAKYSLYLELLHSKMKEYNVEPRHTYNMDEKGFLIGVTSRSKRVFSRRMWDKKEVRASVQDGSREWITLLACVCADGSALPPGLIYQSAGKSLQSSWVDAIKPGEHSIHVSSSLTGWTNNDIGLAWLEQVFDRYTKAKARRSHRLLILDGHGSHVTMDFIEYCDRNKILLVVLPPHSTHTLQPLDVCLFKPLSQAYSSELSSFIQRSQGLLPVKKGDFLPLFWEAWTSSFKPKTILKSFEVTGISPMNPDVILDRFNSDRSDERESEGSSNTTISGSDWRKMSRLVRSAVKDESSKEARRLSRSLHHISVQNQLLHHEIQGFKEALTVKRKHTKYGATLDLQQRREYHGGSVFWSPRKVREARVRQTVRERDKVELQLQKAEAARVRKVARLHKEELAQGKREAREATKAVRQHEKTERAKQAAERTRQREAQNTARVLKTLHKGKKKASESLKRDSKRNKAVADAVNGGECSGAASTASPVTTRRGREVTLPSKYK
jgi:hypothetical protein